MVSFGCLNVIVYTFAGSFFLAGISSITDVSEERDTFSPHIQCAMQKLRSILACISRQPLAFGLTCRNWKVPKSDSTVQIMVSLEGLV